MCFTDNNTELRLGENRQLAGAISSWQSGKPFGFMTFLLQGTLLTHRRREQYTALGEVAEGGVTSRKARCPGFNLTITQCQVSVLGKGSALLGLSFSSC